MTDAAYLELLAGFEQSIEAAHRSLTIARELTEAQRAGRPLPDAVVTAYVAGLERDAARLSALREDVQRYKSLFRTH